MSEAARDLRLAISRSHDTDRRGQGQGEGEGGLFGGLSDTLQPITVPPRLSGLKYLGWMGRGWAWPAQRTPKGTATGMKTKCPGLKPLCDCDTELCGSFSTDRQLSQKSDRCNVAECHGPPVRKRSGKLEDTQYETGLERLEDAAVDEFALDCVHSMCGTEEFQYEPWVSLPEADPSISIPMKSALRDWQLG